MNIMISNILMLEKELELERQGYRRTRRYIGDVNEVTDHRWYQQEISQIAETRHHIADKNQTLQTTPHQKTNGSILNRLFRPSRTRRQPASNEC